METNAEKKAAHCGRPNKAGLNRYGLEFLSSSLSKSGKFGEKLFFGFVFSGRIYKNSKTSETLSRVV